MIHLSGYIELQHRTELQIEIESEMRTIVLESGEASERRKEKV